MGLSNRIARTVRSALLAACAAAAVAAVTPARAATPAEVDRAVERGIEALYKAFDANGNIGGKPGGHDQEGGLDAIAVYALLAARESHQDPRLKKAIENLASLEIKGTYALAMRAQIWQYLPKTPQTRAGLARDAQLLTKCIRTNQKNRGMFRYTAKGEDYDHSASNYGVLGFWGLATAGWEVPTQVWTA